MTQHRVGEAGRFGDVLFEAALFQSGRPIILVPRRYDGRFRLDRVLIAWDGSVHAARAVAAAMPLLAETEIHVFTAKEASKGSNFYGEDLVKHLQRHGLAASLGERSGQDVQETIIREVEGYRASLVVMGGYGHSRFRDFVFGGVTRFMLTRMPVPVLMAH